MANDYMDEPDDQQDAVRGADNGVETDTSSTDTETADDSDAGEPVVIPRSACPGMAIKPGMRMSFVVDRVLEDEFTAHYVSTGAGTGESQPAPDESAMMMD